MHYRRLGRSGIKVSEIALGAWVTFGNQLDEKKASDLIHAAYDQGINFFDIFKFHQAKKFSMFHLSL